MKTTALITVLTIVLAGSAFAQTVSPTDKVLFDRATAFVKGLRDGKSWNKTIAELKKDFPDMKELEPFRAIEGSEIFAREFGALYSFDTAIMRIKDGVQCTNLPQLQFSFYQDKLYRVEVFHFRFNKQQLMNKVASSFFKESDTVTGLQSINKKVGYYNDVRASDLHVSHKDENNYACKSVPGSNIMTDKSRLVFTLRTIENLFYVDQDLLHPDWGYVNMKWNSTRQEVANNYKNIIEKPHENSTFGLRKFIQENNDGGHIKERSFSFFQDSLYEVAVIYKGGSVSAFLKLKLLYRDDVPVRTTNYGGIIYNNPIKNQEAIDALIFQMNRTLRNEQQKQDSKNSDL